MKYDVFISYSSKDQKVVEAMCAYLEQHKVRCFVAYRDIPKGVVWAKAIVEALDESKMMVVVFSEEFNLSDQVDREIELASEDKKPILTFRISDAMFKGAKKYYLKNINWIDAFPHPEKVFDALLDNVHKLIGQHGSQMPEGPATGLKTRDQDAAAEPLCPCGSGKFFKDCHGKAEDGSEKEIKSEDAGGKDFVLKVKGVEYPMVFVEGGTFMMGSDDENSVHKVTLSNYSIGKYEVTQELWEAVMSINSSGFKGARRPVEGVSWDDCQKFISRLNRLTGMNFKLPTEAQWEYAARGGRKSRSCKYSGSNNIDDIAWYIGNSGLKTHDVGTKASNELGLYDMSGNVWEWCSDWYGIYGLSSQNNPVGPSNGSSHVIRGGSFDRYPSGCRVSYRRSCTPDDRSDCLGLRLCL